MPICQARLHLQETNGMAANCANPNKEQSCTDRDDIFAFIHRGGEGLG
jgi:hypothetical protein